MFHWDKTCFHFLSTVFAAIDVTEKSITIFQHFSIISSCDENRVVWQLIICHTTYKYQLVTSGVEEALVTHVKASCSHIIRAAISTCYGWVWLIFPWCYEEAWTMYYTFENTREMKTTLASGSCFLHFPCVLKCPSCFITVYYMATIVHMLWLAAERALFSCNGQALWKFSSAQQLFQVVSKSYERIGENNKNDGKSTTSFSIPDKKNTIKTPEVIFHIRLRAL